MRRLVALLLVLMLAVSFMTVSAAADEGFTLPNPNNEDTEDSGGGNSDPVVGPGAKKELDEHTTVEEETTVPTEETVPTTEATTVPTEVTTVPTEPAVTEAPVVTEAAATQPDPNTVLGVSQQIIGNSTEQVVEEAPGTDSGSETYLLVALIAGLGAVCAVLVIRRILDV